MQTCAVSAARHGATKSHAAICRRSVGRILITPSLRGGVGGNPEAAVGDRPVVAGHGTHSDGNCSTHTVCPG